MSHWTKAKLLDMLQLRIEQTTFLARAVLDGAPDAQRIASDLLGETQPAPMLLPPGMRVGNGTAEFFVEHWAARMLAAIFGRELGDAPNYVEVRFKDEAGRSLLVTIQRPSAKTPHELRREAEDECARLRKLLAATPPTPEGGRRA